MARRKKLKIWHLIALLGIIGMLVFAIAGFLFVKQRRDPKQYIEKANVLSAEGRHEEAVKQFEKAAYYDSNNVDVITGWAEALEKSKPMPPGQAERKMMRLFGLWQKIATFENARDDIIEKMLKTIYSFAEKASEISAFNSLYSLASELRGKHPESVVVKRYHAMAIIGMMRRGNIGQQQIETAKQELEELLELFPDDPDLNTALGHWHIGSAERAGRLNDVTGSGLHLMKARDILARNLEVNPEHLEGQLALIATYSQINEREKALELLDNAEKNILAATDLPSQVVRQFARIALTIDRAPAASANDDLTTNGLLRAEAVIKHQLKNNPDDVMPMVELANTLRMQGRIEEAAEYLRQVFFFNRNVPINEAAMLIKGIQTNAGAELATLLISFAEQTKDPEKRKQLIAETREIVKSFPRNVNTSALIDIIEGKIAILEDDFQKAIKAFETADKKFGGRNPEPVFLSAVLLKRTGETGAAIERFNRLTSGLSGERAFRVYRELVDAYLKTNMISKAEDTINQMLAIRPNDETALLLKSEIMIRRAKQVERENPENPGIISNVNAMYDAAGNIITPLAEAGNRSAQLQLARLQVEQENFQGAKSILEELVEKNPKDLQAFQRLVQLDIKTGDQELARQRIERAKTQNPESNNVYDIMMGNLVDGGRNLSDRLEEVFEENREDDPFTSAMGLYMVHRMKGEELKAEQALETAEQINPNDPRFINARFQEALKQKDWATAESLILRAAEQDLDNADGLFWQARLLIEQSKFKEARDTLDVALERRPLYSEGWRMKGDVHRTLGELVSAENAYQEAIHLKPDNAMAWFNLHQVHERRGYIQRAIEDLKHARFLMPDSQPIYDAYLALLTRHDKAAALKERINLAKKEPGNIDNMRIIAALHIELGQTENARKIIAELLKDDRDNIMNLTVAANYFKAADNFDSGRKLLVNHIEKKGDDAESQDYMALARYLRQGGVIQSAIDTYTQAIEVAENDDTTAKRELADWLFQIGMHNESLPLYRQVLKEDPSERVWLRLIENLVRAEESQETSKQIDAYVKQHGTNAQLALLNGLNALGAKNLGVAEQAFDQAVQMAPDNAQAYLYRARLRLMNKGQNQEKAALNDLEKAISLDETLLSAHEMLAEWHLEQTPPNLSDAANTYRKLVELKPDNLSYRLRLANIFLVREDFPQLDNLLKDGIKQSPDVPMWYRLRAQMHLRQNEQEKALADLNRVYTMDPSAESLAPLAQVLLENGEFQLTLTLFDECPDQERIQRSGILLAFKAAASTELGLDLEARELFATALAFTKEQNEQLAMVINLLFKHLDSDESFRIIEVVAQNDDTGIFDMTAAGVLYSQGKKELAAKRLEVLRDTSAPKSETWTEAVRFLGIVYLELEQHENALEVYKQMLDKDPNDIVALNNIAYIYTEYMNKPETGIALAKKAVELAPENSNIRASVLDTLGMAHLKLGDPDKARLALDESIRIAPSMFNRYHMAQVMVTKGRPDEAMTQLRMAKDEAEKRDDSEMIAKIDELIESVYAPTEL